MDKGEIYTDRYIDYAVHLLSVYDGKEPFHAYLKRYFRENRKHGSKDRRNIKNLCYTYFRLHYGFASGAALKEKLEICSRYLKDPSSIDGDGMFRFANIFPFSIHLSDAIRKDEFVESLLQQPDLFLRIRPGYAGEVVGKLIESGTQYELISEDCLRMPPGTVIEKNFRINKEVVIQDLNSQKTADFLKGININEQHISVWDACAGGGGKSILLKDTLGDISLTVSDIRKSILKNMKQRLKEASVPVKDYFIADLSNPFGAIKDKTFNLILVDAPCSGSGTWARTPEMPVYFKEKEIGRYASLQKEIVRNCLPKLKAGGYLIFQTCSVFKEENEDNIDYFLQNYPLELVSKQYLTGYHKKADTLFGALMKMK